MKREERKEKRKGEKHRRDSPVGVFIILSVSKRYSGSDLIFANFLGYAAGVLFTFSYKTSALLVFVILCSLTDLSFCRYRTAETMDYSVNVKIVAVLHHRELCSCQELSRFRCSVGESPDHSG